MLYIVDMPAYFEIIESFDAALWRVSPSLRAPGSTILVTWHVSPPPVDGGMPAGIAPTFCKALCAIGAAAFEGDNGIVCTTDPAMLDDAFESALHPWWMNAQWIAVTRDWPSAEVESFVADLYRTWTLPAAWPASVKMVVQAAVDGDGAACHCRDMATRQAFEQALVLRA